MCGVLVLVERGCGRVGDPAASDIPPGQPGGLTLAFVREDLAVQGPSPVVVPSPTHRHDTRDAIPMLLMLNVE